MNIFPTQFSVLSAKALQSHLSGRYGFLVTNCQLIMHNVSDTYLVETASDKYIFKIYRDAHRSHDEIMGEMELLDYLYTNGASVSHPLKDVYGTWLQEFNTAEGIRFGVLFSFAQGKNVYVMTDKQLKLVGKEMAKFHVLSSTVALTYPRKKYTVDSTLINPVKVIQPAFKGMEVEYVSLIKIAEFAVQEFLKLDTSNFGYGYCQYDFLPKNFHFEGEEKLTFFDFDFAGQGYLINDITTFYIHFFLDVYYGKMTREEADRCFDIFLAAVKLNL
jgi:Ser/Thr protein kinase RdoA (MazF antagonist)